LILRTLIKSSLSEFKIDDLVLPEIPALLNMMSSLPYLETAVSTAFWTSESTVTLQWT
jgi:hypothetical protein